MTSRTADEINQKYRLLASRYNATKRVLSSSTNRRRMEALACAEFLRRTHHHETTNTETAAINNGNEIHHSPSSLSNTTTGSTITTTSNSSNIVDDTSVLAFSSHLASLRRRFPPLPPSPPLLPPPPPPPPPPHMKGRGHDRILSGVDSIKSKRTGNHGRRVSHANPMAFQRLLSAMSTHSPSCDDDDDDDDDDNNDDDDDDEDDCVRRDDGMMASSVHDTDNSICTMAANPYSVLIVPGERKQSPNIARILVDRLHIREIETRRPPLTTLLNCPPDMLILHYGGSVLYRQEVHSTLFTFRAMYPRAAILCILDDDDHDDNDDDDDGNNENDDNVMCGRVNARDAQQLVWIGANAVFRASVMHSSVACEQFVATVANIMGTTPTAHSEPSSSSSSLDRRIERMWRDSKCSHLQRVHMMEVITSSKKPRVLEFVCAWEQLLHAYTSLPPAADLNDQLHKFHGDFGMPFVYNNTYIHYH